MPYTVILKKTEEKRIAAGHPWVYANEVQKIEGKDKNGSLATVLSSDGRYLGKGYINHASKILVRNQCLILRKGHPLLERAEKTGGPITEAALKAYPRCVLVKPNARIYETQGETICIPNLLLAAPFLRSCDAYAVVGELAYHSYFKQFGITAVNLPEITEETRGLVNQAQMIWHHRYHNSPSHQWLRAVIHSAVREEAEKVECCP